MKFSDGSIFTRILGIKIQISGISLKGYKCLTTHGTHFSIFSEYTN